MSPFEKACNVTELGALFMDRLALSALIALSFTSRTNYMHVQDYMQSKMITIFGPFGLPFQEMYWLLLRADAIIVGSAALRAVAPTILPITVETLDFVVKSYELHFLVELLEYSHNYRRIEPSNHTVIEGISPFHSTRTYACSIHHQVKEINIFVTKGTSPYEFIFHSSNTTEMNMITHDGLFTAYRSLLNRGLVARNHVTNMVNRGTIPNHVKATLQRKIDEDNAKAESQGFAFIHLTQYPHPLRSCQCPHRSACSARFRITTDSMTSQMRLLNSAEYNAVGNNRHLIPTQQACMLPPVVWRLADVELGSQGFAYNMTEDRIANMSNLGE